MYDKQQSVNQRHWHQLQPVTNNLNILTCLLVTLLLLFEGHTIHATPLTRLREQQEQQQQQLPQFEYNSQSHQQHGSHRQQHQQSSFQGHNTLDCEHKSLVELIKTSPIVIKALGAHIYTSEYEEDLHILQTPDDTFVPSWQQSEQTKYRGTLSLSSESTSSLRGSDSTKTYLNAADIMLITLTPDTIYKGASLLKTVTNAAMAAATANRRRSNTNTDSGDGTNDNEFSAYSSAESTVDSQLNATIQPLYCFDGNLLKSLPTDLIIFGKLITIDQTKHKGYSGTSSATSSLSSSSVSSSISSLPSLSVPYSLSNQQQQQHQQQSTATTSTTTTTTTQHPKDILQISINGLHRWSTQLESYIWTHLGWDDWSDFTVCSVACGRGVQQRFRRCLFDNPMVNLKMNFNDIAEEELHAQEEALEVEEQVEEYDDHNGGDNVDAAAAASSYIDADDMDANEEKQYDDIDRMIFEDDDDDELIDQLKAIDNYDSDSDSAISSSMDLADIEYVLGHRQSSGDANEKFIKSFVKHKEKTHRRRTKMSTKTAANQDNILPQADVFEMDNNMLHFVTSRPRAKTKRMAKEHQYVAMKKTTTTTTTTTTTEEPEIMRIFEGDFNDVYSEKIYNESPFNSKEGNKKDALSSKKGQRPAKHKRHKSAKIVSTMFCEGYNIEQRDCNTFECNDDINDLLKFYRKYSATEEANTAATQSLNVDFYAGTGTAPLPLSSSATLAGTSGNSINAPLASTTPNEFGTWNSLTENLNAFTPTFINSGFVQSWHNALNFTLMLTLRAKNDSNSNTGPLTTASASLISTILSIRNGSQHLYLETYRDGLRLYLERDKTTEMLPIQFNLYDYRWHQVAISIKNGDFITIYIDCSWVNSFVVSSRMFTLPTEADVEIARGFNGELQQLLILPGLQGRRQCSDKRISINEVKRYIIDTFIGDYGN